MPALPPPTQYQNPTGEHVGICVRVIDLGSQGEKFGTHEEIRRKLLIAWELPFLATENGSPFLVSKRYTWSMDPRAQLRKDLESWRGGRRFTNADFRPPAEGGFDIQKILGKPCLLSIVEKNGYSEIQRISLCSRVKAPDRTHHSIQYLWLDPAEYDPAVYARLSASLRETIARSPEWKELHLTGDEEPDSAAAFLEDEDIPF